MVDKSAQQFERELARDLATLADGGPAGPAAEAVLSRLRRRSVRRRLSAAGVGTVCLAALLAAATQFWPRQRPVPPPVSGGAAPQGIQAKRPRPLSVPVRRPEAEAAIREYLASAGLAGNVYVSKEGGKVSYVFMGRASIPARQVQEDLETLFRSFDVADVRLWKGRLHYALVADLQDPPRL